MSSDSSAAGAAPLLPRHTPGPWRWTDGENEIDIATYQSPGFYNNPQLKSAAHDDYIIGCDEYWTIGPVMSREEQTANARLIASAPDLLAALKELHADCVEYCRINHLHNDDGGPGTNRAMRRAAETIAKAEGR